jgi:hypothetical protein
MSHLRRIQAPDPVTGRMTSWIPEVNDTIQVKFAVDMAWKGPVTEEMTVITDLRPEMCDS